MSDNPLDPTQIAESIRGIEQRVQDDPEFKAAITEAITTLFGDPAKMSPGEIIDAAAQVQQMLATMVDVLQFGRISEDGPSDEARLQTSALLDLVREDLNS